MNIKQRINTYNKVATELALLSDVQLSELLEHALPMGTGIGGASALLKMDETQIFIKKIRLTDLERQPGHWMSTANMFSLPSYYQYGIGSTGFGAWRELSAHIMSTHWAISGECLHFPLMYHWRILPTSKLPSSSETIKKLNDDVSFWGGAQAIRTRLEAIQNSSAEIVLFLEYFPENVHQWLSKELKKDAESAERACVMVEKNLKAVTSFINAHGLLHFDAHFWNILTDGTHLYFSDFGLAQSAYFDLSAEEKVFFKKHHFYDHDYVSFFMTEWLLTALFGEEKLNDAVQAYKDGQLQLPSYVSKIIVQNYESFTSHIKSYLKNWAIIWLDTLPISKFLVWTRLITIVLATNIGIN